ncbi:hypothetical protein SAMN05446037_103710 [Anaerovirgula multivorans]|uniref:Uncharacterized protein n=1 Tax=Anaerovirgula multivorans TaxID=312168 RepID=A0A239JMN1_9FIRM|nr:hypothetical protein [Anaerovirgula multivorans]SNT07029.1 hypothetical protein SAMN05446037_103710 [Anaerovirgula multivorans]
MKHIYAILLGILCGFISFLFAIYLPIYINLGNGYYASIIILISILIGTIIACTLTVVNLLKEIKKLKT